MKQRGKKKKRIKRSEDNIRDLWDNVKSPNIRIIGVPEEEDKKKGHEKILEDLFLCMVLESVLVSFFYKSLINFPSTTC